MFAGPIIPGQPSIVVLNIMRWLYPSHCRFDLTQFVHIGLSSPHFILRFLHVKHPVFVLFRSFAAEICALRLLAAVEEDGSTLIDPGEGLEASSTSIRAIKSHRKGSDPALDTN
jgi:hypothetical protein